MSRRAWGIPPARHGATGHALRPGMACRFYAWAQARPLAVRALAIVGALALGAILGHL